MKAVKAFLKKTPVYAPLRFLYQKIKRISRHPLQDMQREKGLNIVRLGTDYGGWDFVDTGDLKNSIIVSAGLGEDASFDVEFATKYGAKVIVVDPTPRAIRHFKDIEHNLGKPKRSNYAMNTGKQRIEAYDLSKIDSTQLVLVEKALWNQSTNLKFFAPPNPDHVSHSIINYQNNYRADTSFIEVEAVTVSQLLSDLGILPSDISLLKLDIEGAEIEVLMQCISEGIKPKQILVEFDELNCLSKKGYKRVSAMHAILMDNSYRMVCTDGQANFLYVKG